MSELCLLAHLFKLSKNGTLLPSKLIVRSWPRWLGVWTACQASVRGKRNEKFKLQNAEFGYALKHLQIYIFQFAFCIFSALAGAYVMGVPTEPAASPNSERNLRKRFLADPSGTLSLNTGQSETTFRRELVTLLENQRAGLILPGIFVL